MLATKTEPMVWTYNKVNVFFDPQTGMGSLTTMWEACGRTENKDPRKWVQFPQAQEVIGALCETLNVRKSDIYQTRRGRNGGTWAHWQIAAVYAHYLDPHFYLWWNEQARAHIEGEFVLTPRKFDQILTEMGLHFRVQEEWNGKVANILFQVRELLRQEPSALPGRVPQIEATVKDAPVLDPKISGTVYLFQVENKPGQYKIGSTQRSVISRAKAGPGQTDDVYTPIKEIKTNNAKKLEQKLQNYYKKRLGKHITKELFRLDELDIKLFSNLSDYIDADRFRSDTCLSKAKQDSMDFD